MTQPRFLFGLPLKVAGPAWERDHRDRLLRDFPSTVEYLGEMGGRPGPR